MKKKSALILFILLLCLGSCASSSGYVYYVIDPPDHKLLAHDPKDDLDLNQACTADDQNKAKCIAMLREEYFKMEKELLDARQRIKDLEASCPQP